MRKWSRVATDERGAAALEFALVFPVVAFLIFGLLYGLIAAAAHVSLGHAVSTSVRYAAIATDPLSSTYPSAEAVAARVDADTPFFTASNCTTTVVGDARENAPVDLDVACDFPNPFGKALSALRNLFAGGDQPDAYADSLEMSAHAEARRE